MGNNEPFLDSGGPQGSEVYGREVGYAEPKRYYNASRS